MALVCAQFLGACTKQEPYILITELMAGGSMADTFRLIQVTMGWTFLESRFEPECSDLSHSAECELYLLPNAADQPDSHILLYARYATAVWPLPSMIAAPCSGGAEVPTPPM